MPTLTPSADLWPQGGKGQTCETKNVQTKLRSSQTPQNSPWPSPPKPARSSGRRGLPPPPGRTAASAEATWEQWGAPSPTPGREGPRPRPPHRLPWPHRLAGNQGFDWGGPSSAEQRRPGETKCLLTSGVSWHSAWMSSFQQRITNHTRRTSNWMKKENQYLPTPTWQTR